MPLDSAAAPGSVHSDTDAASSRSVPTPAAQGQASSTSLLSIARRRPSGGAHLPRNNSSSSSSILSTSQTSREKNDILNEDEDSRSPVNLSPSVFGQESYWTPRRPSTISDQSASSSHRRPSSSSASQHRTFSRSRRPSSSSNSLSAQTAPSGSPPTTPTLRSSSRSKILASSAMVIEGVSTPTLPFEYRNRTPSADGGLLDSSSPTKELPRFGTQRMASPPIPTSKSTIVASTSGGTSLAERKRRLASASGVAVFDETEMAPRTLNAPSPRMSTTTSSSSLHLPTAHSDRHAPPKSPSQASPKPLNEGREKIDSKDTNAALKPSLRSRLFGLRRGAKESHNGGQEEDRASVFSASSVRTAGTDYSKDMPHSSQGMAPSSSFAASIDGTMSKSSSSRSFVSGDKPTSSSSSFLRRGSSKSKKMDQERSKESETGLAEGLAETSRGGSNAAKAVGKESLSPESSWITSLSSVSPTGDLLDLPLPISRSGSRDDSALSDDSSKVQRNGSWPPSDRKGSFLRAKGSGEFLYPKRSAVSASYLSDGTTAAGKAYRFDNAAINAKTNSPREMGGPAFLATDPSRNIDVPPANSERWRNGDSPSSPIPDDVDRLDSSRRPHMHRSDSARSVRSTQGRSSPRIYPAIARPTTSDDSKRTLHTSLSASLQAEAAADRGHQHSSYDPSTSPRAYVPRRSSLQGRSPPAPTRSSSTALNTLITQQGMEEEDIKGQQVGQSNRRASWRSSTMSVKPMSAAGAAGAGAVAAIRANFGDARGGSGGEKQDRTSSDKADAFEEDQTSKSDQTEQATASPQSLETARQELSPSSMFGLSEPSPSTGDKAQTLSVSTLEPAMVRHAQPVKQKEEPKRPTKSPLRVTSSSSSVRETAAQDMPARRVASSPMPIQARPRQTDQGPEQDLESLLALSPPRKSIEEMVQLDAVTFGRSTGRRYDDSITMTSPNVDHMSSNEVRLQPVPDSAKRLGALTRDAVDLELPSANASTQSLTTEEEYSVVDLLQPDKSAWSATKGLSKHYKSLRKVTPPALASAFSKTTARSNVVPDSVTEEEVSDIPSQGEKSSGSTTPGTMAKRRMKKWPFGKESGEIAAPDWDPNDFATMPGRGSKMTKSLRGRKTEPAATKPTIRRIFDEPRLDEAGVESEGSDAGDERETAAVPSMASLEPTESTSSLPHAASLSQSSPALPSTPSEGLSGEAKLVVRRRNVIRELIETERSYAADLAVVRDIYLARARAAAGLSSSTPLQTPLSSHSTPIHSPLSTPAGSTSTLLTMNNASLKTTPLSASHRDVQRVTSSELPQLPTSPALTTHAAASPSSFASSSDPSNRSSTYTVSSQTSQTSDSSSFPFHLANPPPLPATPPNLSGLTASTSSSTLYPASPSSYNSTSTFSMARSVLGKPKVNISTTSFQRGSGEAGLSSSDVRVIFAHLETCCSFADDMASILAGAMGTFARSKRVNISEVTAEMDKEDDTLGETFLNLMSRIRAAYIDYCSRHEASMMRLQEVIASSPGANAFFKECTEVARKHTNAWDLASLLIKPVQRVLKYPLLIQQIVNSTRRSHPDYKNLTLAYDEIQAVADEINQVKKRKDLADHLITGRVKEARNVAMPGSTIKGKKKSTGKLKEVDGNTLLTTADAEESSMAVYAEYSKRFYALLELVSGFGQHCSSWAHQMREAYEGQLKVFIAMRRVYRLRVEEEGPDGSMRVRASRDAARKEETLMTSYIRLQRVVLTQDWQQLDTDIRATIVPMTVQIHQMFEAPRMVMGKRDERQADYHRYRQALQTGRQVERRVLEGANGFIALNAQLVEELPLFIAGVQTLLDVGVQALARLQAGHFDQVRNRTLDFWGDVAKRGDEIEVSAAGCPTISHINPVRAFWDRHSDSAGWIESLGIHWRNRKLSSQGAEEAEHGEIGSAVSTPGQGNVTLANTLQVPTLDRKGGSSPSLQSVASATPSTTSYLQPTTSARRPSGVAGLMRSLSGTFVREQGHEEVPPLPSDASVKQEQAINGASSASDTAPPLLPSLVFRDGEGEGGYFVQAAPIPFLDTEEIKEKKVPYGLSPSIVPRVLPDIKAEETLPVSASANRSSGDYYASLTLSQASAGGSAPNGAPKRHKMNILYECTATADSTVSSLHSHDYLGWPFLPFVKGDSLKVLSSDDTGPTPMLFGRIDRTGDLGWAEKRCF